MINILEDAGAHALEETSAPEPAEGRAERTGAQLIWEALLAEGVEVCFGYPGGAIMPAYDSMIKYPIHHVLVRHEQGASHMADGYARVKGDVGVCVATSGPAVPWRPRVHGAGRGGRYGGSVRPRPHQRRAPGPGVLSGHVHHRLTQWQRVARIAATVRTWFQVVHSCR